MAYVTLDSSGNITGLFGRPQPDLPGYAEIQDDDPRLVGLDLANAKTAKCAAIDTFRDNTLVTGYADTTTGKSWQCDDASIGKWTAVASSALATMYLNTTPAPTFGVIPTDNTIVSLSAASVLSLFNGRVLPWVSSVMLNARNHKNAVNALADIASVQAYDFSGGW